MSTKYHSQYYAYELTKQNSADSVGRISQSLINATVDLNPHQVEAALFAFRAPLERGALLADEVGLGKTIEAGLIISQLWAERKRRILIIVPPPLRKQWALELEEKFYIHSLILESKNFNEFQKDGLSNPFNQKDNIVICSYQFARNKSDEIKRAGWDLIVIDEAHRLRNVYKKNNKIGRELRDTTAGVPKLLLTATPLQNSLMELYGLISFLDPHIFGDSSTFRKQFARGYKEMSQAEFIDLKQRIKPVCHRTLRRQVTEYVNYTQRIPIAQEFYPNRQEYELYEKVSSYLQRNQLFALPRSQRALMTLVVRKLLASSSFAIADTLRSLINRLDAMLIDITVNNEDPKFNFFLDVDEIDDTFEEWEENIVEIDYKELTVEQKRILIKQEKEELQSYYDLANSILQNAKGDALVLALNQGFEKMKEIGANDKAVIFTESRRTQLYLKEMLHNNGYKDKVVLFNGSNSDQDAKEIYHSWLEKHKDDSIVTGSKSVDMRTALVDHFKNNASIMIATESAAEGINLQFCSLVVNYDLPWNPQRVEQRIGRCHRYGQKHDVVVINFLNQKNEADRRVFELLSEKFKLFEGVFGSSDEVLGSLESGVDFEKRIQEIYQNCRTAEEITQAFVKLQEELDEQIKNKMSETRANLLENFDDEVREKLRDHYEQTALQLNKMERLLWNLSKIEGAEEAVFDDDSLSFLKEAKKYQLFSRYKSTESINVNHYRLSHPIAVEWLDRARDRKLPTSEVVFSYKDYAGKVSVLESLIGEEGWLKLDLLNVDSVESEQHLIFSAITNSGKQIDHETCEKMFNLPACNLENVESPTTLNETLDEISNIQEESILNNIMDRAGEYLDSEIEKLDRWAKDLKMKLEFEIEEITSEVDILKRDSKSIRNVKEKLELNKKIKELEKKRNNMRRSLYDQQDEIDNQKDKLFEEVEAKLEQKVSRKELFTIKWKII